MKTIFIGTSDFAAIILSFLFETKYKPDLIVTNPDRPAGRGNKIKETPVSFVSGKKRATILKPEKISELKSEIEKICPDLILVCSYSQIIPENILEIPKFKCLNVHPSILPKYRGPSPIQSTILNGEDETGVTIIEMIGKVDAGPIIKKEKLGNKEDRLTYHKLHDELANLGANLLIKTIPDWINGKIKPEPQDESKATYTEIITKKKGRIDWKDSAEKIDKKVRALNPWPGSYSFFYDKKEKKEKMMKILETDIQIQTENGPFGAPGKVYMATNNELAIQTGKDFLIVKKLQIENKNSINSSDFINGNIDFIGTILK